MIDPRLEDPTEPIYQTPDKVVEDRGRIQRREREVYLPPERIQRTRRQEYNNQLKAYRENDPEAFKRYMSEQLKEEVKEILKDAAIDAFLEGAFTGMGGGVRPGRGGYQKQIENGGVPPIAESPRIERSECEVCIIFQESEFESIARYRKENPGSGDLRDVVVPRKERIICWRSNKPECQPKPIEPEPPIEHPELPPVEPFDPTKCQIELGIGVSSRQETYRKFSRDNLPDEYSEGNEELAEIKRPLRFVRKEIESFTTEWARVPNTPFHSLHNQRVTANRIFHIFHVVDSLGNDVLFNGEPIIYMPSKGQYKLEEQYAYDYTGHFGTPDEITYSYYVIHTDIFCIKDKEEEENNNLTPEQPEPLMNCNCDKIYADLKAIKKILGLTKFPIKAPRRLVNVRKKGDVKLDTYPELFEYLVRLLDRAVGFLPMTVTVKDTNAVQEGDQPLVVQIESIADGLRELIQIACNDEKTGDATQNIAFRTMYETGIIHKLVAEMHYELNEIQEYLGYEVIEKNIEIPMSFNPLAKGLKTANTGDEDKLNDLLSEILTEKKVKIKVAENVDKKTLYSGLLEVHRQATIAAAGVSERVGSRGALDTLMNGTRLAMEAAQLMQQRQILRILGGLTPNELENLMNELELRYTKGQSPIAEDQNEPFQKENRPKIKLVRLDPERLKPPGVS